MEEQEQQQQPEVSLFKLTEEMAKLASEIQDIQRSYFRQALAMQVLSANTLMLEKLVFSLLPKGIESEIQQEYAARVVEVTNLSAAAMSSPRPSGVIQRAIGEILEKPFSALESDRDPVGKTEPEAEEEQSTSTSGGSMEEE